MDGSRSKIESRRRTGDFRGVFVPLIKAVVPAHLRCRLRERLHLAVWPPIGRVRFGGLRRVTPISPDFGFSRGLPVDRFYIEQFLRQHAGDIRGRVLEVADNAYTTRFGGAQVLRSDVLNLRASAQASLVGDLATGEGIPSGAFDCIILTQVLHLVYDVKAAITHSYRALKPGGVLLATVPGISQICRDPEGRWKDQWRLTSHSAAQLFGVAFPSDNIEVRAHGNVMAAMAFLHGLAVDDLKREELEYCDPDYEVSITVRAAKPGGSD